jgi:molybdopterin/thiamine biosynthesis adenylyltransferase
MEALAFYKEMVGRNIGVLSDEEQHKLKDTCIAVAGCGGMGGLSAEQLVRLGVGHVKIADFDKFCVHNLSRQCGSATSNIGQHKAEVLGRHFRDINPHLKLDIFKEGVTPQNADKFLDGAKAVIDGTDLSKLESTIAMYETARKNNICVVNPNAIGYGVNVFVFGPKTVSLKDYIGIGPGVDPRIALLKLVPYVPSYVDPEVMRKIAMGEMYLPNIAMPQYMGTSIAVSEAVLMVLGKIPQPAGPDPRIFIIDMLDRVFRVTG